MVVFIMRLVLLFITLLAALICLAVLGLVVGAFADPTGSLFAVVGSMVWATVGPFLFLGALTTGIIGVAAFRFGLKGLGGVVVAVSAMSVLGSGVILGRLGLVAVAAGANIDPLATLRLGRMDRPAPDMVETFETVEGTDLRAAVYLPPSVQTPAPVIVYVHGGGFMAGSFTETAADLRWFADRGWLVVSVEYRLFGPASPTWDKAMRDASCGVAWAHRNAARFGGDARRLAVLGDSAGGNLAINLGFAAAAGNPVRDCASAVPVPRAIAVQYPAVDAESIYRDGYPIPGFEPEMLIEGYIGGLPEQYPGRMAAISSATYVTEAAPPTLIILPEKDSLVVAHGTDRFAQDAMRAGVDLRLVRLPFTNHVFNQMAANSLGNKIGRTLRLRFLEAHVR
jgi:acetyl esterase/lipase